MPNRKWAALAIAATAGACLTLVSCSGGSASSPAGSVSRSSGQPTGGTTPRSAGRTSALGAGGKSTQPTADALPKASGLTGNFCADYKNIGKNIPVPSGRGSLSALRQRSARYLRRAAAYYDGLASEASPQAGRELRVISSANLALANLISRGKVRARSQLTTRGVAAAASGRLVIYVATRCG